MTLYQNKPTQPNESAMRALIQTRYDSAVATDNGGLPQYPRHGFVTKLIKLIEAENACTENGRMRVAGALWAASRVVVRDLQSDEEV